MSPPLHHDWRLEDEPFPFAGRSLAPQTDPTQLSYYLDFYEWQDPDALAGLRADGTIQIGALQAAETTTVLISGSSGSGRSSVRNLLVYELIKQAATPPIVLDVRVKLSPDRKQVAMA